MGLVAEKENTRSSLIKITALVIPLFSAIAYFLMPNPITLLLIAGIWAALGLASYQHWSFVFNKQAKQRSSAKTDY